MIIALRELRRNPRRFVTATVVLDAARGVALVSRRAARRAVPRFDRRAACTARRRDRVLVGCERLDHPLPNRSGAASGRRQVPGVTAVRGLGITLVGTTVPGRNELVDTAVIGYEGLPHGVPAPPPAGEAWADRRLAAYGVRRGQVLGVGPQQVPVKVRGWVDDTNYLLQGALWVEPSTWRHVQETSRPDARVANGTFQVLAVSGTVPADQLARHIDAATSGKTKTLTKSEAVLSSPGTREQKSTFAGIIDVTFLVVGAGRRVVLRPAHHRTDRPLRRAQSDRRADIAPRRRSAGSGTRDCGRRVRRRRAR